MTAALEMSPTEYARHRGVTPPAISKLLRNSKIPFRVVKGKKLIDAAAADRALGEERQRVDVPDEEGYGARGVAPSGAGARLTEAKAASALYDARMAQITYEEKIGRVVRTADVLEAMQKCAAAIVRDLDQMTVHAEALASAAETGGVNAVRAKLKDIVRSTRIVLAQNMRLLETAEEQASS